ncbi:Mu-like prophage major head subunit gpT family protein [bacterium]|nr:Mu-like prophage major head subunit gpT family protein [bacterium]
MPPSAPPRKPAKARHAITATARVTIAAAGADAAAPRTFELVAYTGEPMRIYPWENPVVVDLETVDASGVPFPALYDHIPDEHFIVGQIGTVDVGGGRIVARGRFTPSGRPECYAARVLARADAGYQWQASIGGDPASVTEVRAGESVQVNGRTYQGPVTVARGVTLREISFVVLGGDRRTSAVVARHRKPPSVRGGAMTPSFEEYVASLGFDPSALDETQTANLKLQYAEAYPEGGGDGAGGEEVMAADEVPAELPTDDEELAAMEEETEEVVQAAEDEDPSKLPTNARAKLARLKAGLKRIRRARRVIARTKKPALTGSGGGGGLNRPSAVTAERARVAEITRVCADAGHPRIKAGKGPRVDLAAHAIAEGWSVDKSKLEALQVKRDSRPTGPAVIDRGRDRDMTVQALQGAMLLRAGVKLDSKAFESPKAVGKIPDWLRAGINDANRNRFMDAAHRYNDASAVDLCRYALQAAGKNVPIGRNDMIQAAFSGGGLSNIFTTNVNAVLLTSYMEATDTTESWTSVVDVNDFKTQERPRVEIGDGLSPLPRGGTAEDADYSDNVESYKVARLAKKFTVDEQDIIDDNLGALSDVPRKFGEAASWARPDLVYSILLGNPTLNATGRALFNSTDGNTGTGAALARDKIKAAISAMMLVRENGKTLNFTPTHLIVPTTLLWDAQELLTSATIVIAGTAGAVTEKGSRNVLSDMNLTIVADGRLDNGVTDPFTRVFNAGSTSTWYLASTFAHLIEVAYLRGTGRAPRVRPYTLDRGQYGVGWDVSLDIGAKALDWKGLQRRQQ